MKKATSKKKALAHLHAALEHVRSDNARLVAENSLLHRQVNLERADNRHLRTQLDFFEEVLTTHTDGLSLTNQRLIEVLDRHGVLHD